MVKMYSKKGMLGVEISFVFILLILSTLSIASYNPFHLMNGSNNDVTGINNSLEPVNQSFNSYLIQHSVRIGAVPNNTTVWLTITLKYRNDNALKQLLNNLYNSQSPSYHKFLSNEQFISDFSPSALIYNQIVAYLKSNGINVTYTYNDRVTISIKDNVATIEKLFNIPFYFYKTDLPGYRQIFWSASGPLQMPEIFVPYIKGIDGTTDAYIYHNNVNSVSMINKKQSTSPFYTINKGIQDVYSSDLQKAYDTVELYNNSATGAQSTTHIFAWNRTIVSIDWEGTDINGNQVAPYNPSDIFYYYEQHMPVWEKSANGMPHIWGIGMPGTVPPGTSASSDITGMYESNSLDLEYSGMMAPGSNVILIYGPGNGYGGPSESNFPDNEYNAAVSLKNLSVVANQWGSTDRLPSSAVSSDVQQMEARGVSVLSSVGNNATTTSMEYPATFANNSYGVTAVGGTNLTLNGAPSQDGTGINTLYPIENQIVWYNSKYIGTESGNSSKYPIPDWQDISAVINNGGNKTQRNVADISSIANNSIVYAGGNNYIMSGTGVAVTVAAGEIAEIDAYLGIGSSGSSYGLGYLNPLLYQIGANNTKYNLSPFFDVTYSPPGYRNPAKVGWDLPSGWGSINAWNFTMSLKFWMSATPKSISVVAGYTVKTVVSVYYPTLYNSSVHLNVSGLPAGASSTFSPSYVTPSQNNKTAGKSTLIIDTLISTSPGTYTFNITGRNYNSTTGTYGNLTNKLAVTMLVRRVSITPNGTISLDYGQNLNFTSNVSTNIGSTPYTYQWILNKTTPISGATQPYYNFFADHVAIYNLSLNVTNSTGSTFSSIPAEIIVHPALHISINPVNPVVDIYQNVTFKVSITGGSNPYKYQWFLNGTKSLGATGASYRFVSSNGGKYNISVSVTDSSYIPNTTMNYSIAYVKYTQLIVSITPSTNITVHVNNKNITLNSSVSGGNSPYQYQWLDNGSAISGATASNYIFSPVHAGSYKIALNVTDKSGNVVTSNDVTITVKPPLSVSITPGNPVKIDINQSVLLTSTIISNGVAPYTYIWLLNNATTNMTGSSYIFSAKTPGEYNISLKVTDSSYYPESATSNVEMVHVYPAISISITPFKNVTVDYGNSVTFKANATGGVANYSYQWFLNGTILTGVTGTSYTFTPAVITNYTVSVSVTDSSYHPFTTFSKNITVIVKLPLRISVNPMNTIRIDYGQTVVFNGTVKNGDAPYHYQWVIDGKGVSGATNSTFTFIPSTVTTYYVSLNVTDSSINSTIKSSTVTTVKVNGVLYASLTPSNTTTIPTGRSITINANVHGGIPPFRSNWLVNGISQNINSTTFSFSSATAGSYNITYSVSDFSYVAHLYNVSVKIIVEQFYSIYGYVRSNITNKVLANVSITITNLNTSGQVEIFSNVTGYYNLPMMPSDYYNLTFSYTGYRPAYVEVYLHKDSFINVTLILVSSTTPTKGTTSNLNNKGLFTSYYYIFIIIAIVILLVVIFYYYNRHNYRTKNKTVQGTTDKTLVTRSDLASYKNQQNIKDESTGKEVTTQDFFGIGTTEKSVSSAPEEKSKKIKIINTKEEQVSRSKTGSGVIQSSTEEKKISPEDISKLESMLSAVATSPENGSTTDTHEEPEMSKDGKEEVATDSLPPHASLSVEETKAESERENSNYVPYSLLLSPLLSEDSGSHDISENKKNNDEAVPEKKADVEICYACKGIIKHGMPTVKCNICKRAYHELCAKRVKTCILCNSTLEAK